MSENTSSRFIKRQKSLGIGQSIVSGASLLTQIARKRELRASPLVDYVGGQDSLLFKGRRSKEISVPLVAYGPRGVTEIHLRNVCAPVVDEIPVEISLFDTMD